MALGAHYGFDTIKQTHQSYPNACHPGRRPGIHCTALPFANTGCAFWIPAQGRDDKSESIKSEAQKQP
jgi:hypothetical protein